MRQVKVILMATLAIAVSGCATKSYIDERVAGLESRLDEHGVRLDRLTDTSRHALERATDAGKLAEGKFLYTVVFTHDGISFDTDKYELSDGARSQLAELAGDLMAKNRSVYLEIQGHTDSTGPAVYNQHLGLMRAESVRRHLHAQGVALDRMATISYGEEAPVEPNDTANGRAMNRRVEVVVLI
jgi:outer membrane protein OmpA-like peptidoglycan-associated protein